MSSQRRLHIAGTILAGLMITAGAFGAAVAILTVQPSSSNQMSLSWPNGTGTIQNYHVYRNGALISTLPGTQSTYQDSGLLPLTSYSYQVAAMSAAVSGTTLAPTPPPAPSWQNTSFASQSGSFTAQFDAVPMMANQDSVVGLSRLAASAYTDLAAIVRFGVNGVIDVRNGSSYSAGVVVSNVAQRRYHVRMVVNVATKRYNVYITPQGQAEILLASNYAFRNSQSTVASLANFAKRNDVGDVAITNFSISGVSAPSPTPTPMPSPSPTPAPVGNCINNVWQNLEACGWPGPGNTGWRHTGVTLTPSGSIVVNTAGAVIDSLDVNGTITINASNVTVRRSRVRASAFGLIQIKSGVTGVRIEDCELDGKGLAGVTNSMGVIGGSATVLRSNIYGVENGVTPQTNGYVIQDNYIHDLGAPGSPHYDNIQIDGGLANIVISHNTLSLRVGQTSAIMVDNYFGPVDNVLIDNNLMAGGGFTVYASNEFNGGPVTNIRHTNNKFSTIFYPCVGQFGVWFVRGQPSDGWRRSGNVVLETGEVIDNTNPHVSGQLCN